VPELGEHSTELLRELGYGEEETAKLLEDGAVVQGGPDNFPWAPVRNKG